MNTCHAMLIRHTVKTSIYLMNTKGEKTKRKEKKKKRSKLVKTTAWNLHHKKNFKNNKTTNETIFQFKTINPHSNTQKNKIKQNKKNQKQCPLLSPPSVTTNKHK